MNRVLQDKVIFIALHDLTNPVELAHWYYVDFVREKNPTLPALASLKAFTAKCLDTNLNIDKGHLYFFYSCFFIGFSRNVIQALLTPVRL